MSLEILAIVSEILTPDEYTDIERPIFTGGHNIDIVSIIDIVFRLPFS